MRKVCKSCLKELDASGFHKNALASDGLSCYCKTCMSIRLHEYYLRPDVRKRSREYSLKYKKTEKGKACIKARVERVKNRKYALKNQMLTFHLKKEWFEKNKSGEKRIEYRPVKPYWTEMLNKAIQREFEFMFDKNDMPDFSYRLQDKGSSFTGLNIPCIFRRGYNGRCLKGTVTEIHVINGKNTDLNIDDLVFAIHFKLDADNDFEVRNYQRNQRIKQQIRHQKNI